jgi:tetratricopeptide (TPR) repeat protein
MDTITKSGLRLLFLLLAGCSAGPTRELPPVVESSGRTSDTTTVPVEQPSAVVVTPLPEATMDGDAVVALVDQSGSYQVSGDADAAAASLERALRIEPRNARLWQRLARVRLEQGEAAQAEQLALKSNALARTDQQLRAENWRIVAQARWAMNDDDGARRAEQKALELQSR